MISYYAEILPLSSKRDDGDARSSNKGQNRILRPKLIRIKSGIIHGWEEVAAIFFFFSKWRPARGRSCRRPAKIETVCHRGHMSQIWCFWKNLNQKSLSSLTTTITHDLSKRRKRSSKGSGGNLYYRHRVVNGRDTKI